MAHYISFNPRTREGATRGYGMARIFTVVSIHAPVKVRPDMRFAGSHTYIWFQSTHP